MESCDEKQYNNNNKDNKVTYCIFMEKGDMEKNENMVIMEEYEPLREINIINNSEQWMS